MSLHIIGIDVGGTKIACGIAAFPEGAALARRTIPTRPERGGRAVLDDVLELAGHFGSEAKASGTMVAAIGLGLCELVDREGRIASANCIHWLDQSVQRELAAIAPTIIEADVRAAALAEAMFGAAKSFRTFLYVTIGTGISCCLIIDGQPYLGARGATGTMASSPLSVPCENCAAVNRRTLEEIAAGPALVRRFEAMGGKVRNAPEVLAAASAGNDRAREIVRTASLALASQVALLVNILDPEAVVVGGGLGLSEGAYWDEFIAATRRHVWSSLHRELPILRAATGADAGWLGAAAAAFRKFHGDIVPEGQSENSPAF